MSDQEFIRGISLMLNQSETKTTELYLYIFIIKQYQRMYFLHHTKYKERYKNKLQGIGGIYK